MAPEVVKPDNQLQLTETELKEDIAKMLTTALPDAAKAAVRYIYREHAWRPEAANIADSVMMHYSCDGWLLHRTADEARRQDRARTQAAASFAAYAREKGEVGVHVVMLATLSVHALLRMRSNTGRLHACV